MLKKIIKSPYLWAFFIGICSLHIIKHFALLRRQAPEPLVEVPDWQLINHENQAFGQKELLGKITIADFFFTSCPSICPKLTEAMKELYVRFNKQHDRVAFVSISVDPEIDTPEYLKSFMAKHKLLYPNWHFLTSTHKKDVHEVVVNKMHVHMGEREPVAEAPGVYDIPHMAQIALFDQKGRLRGLFKTDSIEMAALVRAAHFLLEKPDI
jgi:protein SCO1/2